MANTKIPKKISFEEALSQLESVVNKLETGDLPLEEALEVFNQGVELSKVCVNKLDTAKQKIEKVLESEDGESYTLKPFEELEQ